MDYWGEVEDDEALIPEASPWPLAGGHGSAILLHLLNGALLIGVVLLAPAPFPEAGAPFTELRIGAAGMIGFATLVSIGFSTIATVASFRLISRFKKLPPARRSLALFGSLVLAHLVGCGAGFGAVGLASGFAYFG